jgi:hypothetical protein
MLCLPFELTSHKIGPDFAAVPQRTCHPPSLPSSHLLFSSSFAFFLPISFFPNLVLFLVCFISMTLLPFLPSSFPYVISWTKTQCTKFKFETKYFYSIGISNNNPKSQSPNIFYEKGTWKENKILLNSAATKHSEDSFLCAGEFHFFFP